MSCLDVYTRTRIIESIQKKTAQLEKACETFEGLLEKEIVDYKFDTNEGSQWVRRRKLTELKEIIDSLESEIAQLYRRLACGGIVNMRLRRKTYPWGYPSTGY